MLDFGGILAIIAIIALVFLFLFILSKVFVPFLKVAFTLIYMTVIVILILVIADLAFDIGFIDSIYNWIETF